MKHLLLVLALTATSGFAADPAPPPKAGGVRFPDFPAPPAPTPPPPADPAAAIKLARGQFYVIASDRPLLILQSGAGQVSVTKRTPPFMLPIAQTVGSWPDSKDPEFVTWGAETKNLYVLKAAKTGAVDLLVIPAVTEVDAATKEQIPLAAKDVTRKTLAVDDGATPAPVPVDPPTPVDPVVPVPGQPFRVLFLFEKEQKLDREQLNIANSTKIAQYLNEKCVKGADGRPDWRKWDNSTVARPGGLDKESAVLRKLFADAQPKLGALPQVVIATGQTAATFVWPPTEAEMLALLRRYGG